MAPLYTVPSTVSVSKLDSVSNVVAVRKPPVFTVMEQEVAKSYGDGKFELVTHESVEFTEHDPLFRRSAHVGVGIGVGVGAVGDGALDGSDFGAVLGTLLGEADGTLDGSELPIELGAVLGTLLGSGVVVEDGSVLETEVGS